MWLHGNMQISLYQILGVCSPYICQLIVWILRKHFAYMKSAKLLRLKAIKRVIFTDEKMFYKSPPINNQYKERKKHPQQTRMAGVALDQRY